MKRKNPPYKIEIGEKFQEPPMYVSAILQNRVILKGSDAEFEKHNLQREIYYKGTGPYETNQELITLMLKLRDCGAAFSYDYKTTVSPSRLMQILKDEGVLKKEYKEISWRNQNEWTLTAYELD